MKKSTILSGALLLSFFLPWVDFNFIAFSGYDLPRAVSQLMSFGGKSSSPLLYAVYLLPLASALKLAGGFKLIQFPENLSKIDYFLALVVVGFVLYYTYRIPADYLSFLGIGIYATVILAVLGLVVKDGEIGNKQE